ncbi:MAG: ATP-binding protein [Gemmatimonadetes bacterium]|nr:ATP-binding protein [Gemmatimonadota bacterium]
MGQTRVDLLHLLEDLRDAYPAGLEETIVGETVANALDSGARLVTFDADTEAVALIIRDDGQGMTRAQLRRYHDLATTTKRRGRGIGFAGVGIKLALLECDEVVTESRRGPRAYATSWRLASRQKAPWQYTDPPGLVTGESGTALRLSVSNPLSPLLDPGWLATTLLRGFAPLFDPTFDDILASAYPDGVRFRVNGHLIPRAVAAPVRLLGDHPLADDALADRATLIVKLPRKRKPSAVGWIARSDTPLPEAERGVAVSTFGKVIRRGWDWLGISPAVGDRTTGLVEAPGLAESLQLNKADFIRTGSRGATYLAYRKAVQQAVSEQLGAWGEGPGPERQKQPRTRPIERDLEHVLLDMADEFPLLGALVERRAGGQKRIPVARPGSSAAAAASPGPWAPGEGLEGEASSDGNGAGGELAPEPPGSAAPGLAAPPTPAPEPDARPPSEGPSAATTPDVAAALPGRAAGRKRGRYSLEIRFESRAASDELARLVESTVLVNDAHPAWHRAESSRAEGYHIALCVAMALAPLAVEPAAAHAFITAFLARWGETAGKKKRRRSRTKRRT